MTKDGHVSHAELRRLCTEIQAGFGVPEADAAIVADCLVEADLMGISTHGVIRLKFYMDRVREGGNNAGADIRIVKEHACTALLDGDNGLGPVVGTNAMSLAIQKAEQTGLAAVSVRNCNHYGPAGYYARMALAHGMIGFSMCNVLASMPPTGGAQARTGNNPVAVAIPAGDESPVVFDVCTSKSSWGKLFLCAKTGENLPEGCFQDANGNATVDPAAVMAGGSLLPIAEHKGYGMAVAIELLTGMLAGAELDHEIPHPYKRLGEPGANSCLMGALRVDHFAEFPAFTRRMDEWIRLMHGTLRAPGVERVWVPGEMETVSRQEKLESGISLPEAVLEELRELAQQVGAEFAL